MQFISWQGSCGVGLDVFFCYLSPQMSGEYSVLFEDTTYPDGYSPPLDVPQRYVLPVRETRKK